MSLAEIGAVLLAENIKQTANLVIVGGRDIALIRKTYEDDGAGGRKPTGQAAQAAVKRFLAPVSADVRETATIPGTSTVADYILIGMPGDDIQDEDHFVIGTITYDIAFVDPNQDYQVKAFVTVRH